MTWTRARGYELVLEARRWIGTPWQHQQSCKGVGVDCIGLVGGVALAVGVPEAARWAADPRWKGYGRTPDPKILVEACDELMDPVAISALDFGDVLVMRFESEPQHFALVSALDPLYIIHAYAQARRVAEHRVDALWRSRILRAYRFR